MAPLRINRRDAGQELGPLSGPNMRLRKAFRHTHDMVLATAVLAVGGAAMLRQHWVSAKQSPLPWRLCSASRSAPRLFFTPGCSDFGSAARTLAIL